MIEAESLTIGVEVEREPRGNVNRVARYEGVVVVSAWSLPVKGGSRRLTPGVRAYIDKIEFS